MSAILSKTGAFLQAAVVAAAILACGQTLWGVLAAADLRLTPAIPWAPPLMAAILATLILYLGGAWGWPRRTAPLRRRLLRWNPVPWPVFGWAVLAGALGMAALGGLWITTSDLVRVPPGLTPSVAGAPIWTALSIFLVAIAAAPLSEEAAFRGYAQGLLERSWKSGWAAVVGASVLFAAAHVVQGLDLTKLGLYFTAGLVFGATAQLTNSLYPAMVVHSLGDILGFLLLWPHDRPHRLVTEGGADPLFWPAVATLAVFAPLAIAAFARLARLADRNGLATAAPATSAELA